MFKPIHSTSLVYHNHVKNYRKKINKKIDYLKFKIYFATYTP